MNDEFYSNKSRNSGNSNSGRSASHHEPHYEDDFSKEDIDTIFSDRRGFSDKASKRSGGFKVSIPDDNISSDNISSQSRVPKGKPVSPSKSSNFSSGVSNNVYSSKQPYDISSASSGRPVQSRSVQGKSPVKQNSANRVQNNFAKQNNISSNKPANRKAKKGKGKSSSKKKIVLSVLCVIVVLFVAIFAYLYSLLGKINYDESTLKENQYISDSELASNNTVKNILFIGSDARSEIEGMRSDTMMLFSIDKANKKIKLTSFLRDSYVCIPSTGKYRKLNAACSAGGAQLVIDTIEYNFKIKIDSYVSVDFEAFKKFINLMGGLDVPDVTKAEAKYMREEVKIKSVKAGTNHFTGGQALWYCRIRYLDDDFHRTQRQRKVISCIVNQATKLGPKKLFDIVEEVIPMITTDVSRNELVSLGAGAIVKYLHYDIEQHQIPAKGTWSNATIYPEGAVLKMDIQKNADLLYDFIYKDISVESETTKKANSK